MIAKPVIFTSLLCLSFLVSGVATAVASPTKTDASAHTGNAIPAALRPALYQALAHETGPAYGIGKDGCTTISKQQLEGCFTGTGAYFAGSGSKELMLRLTGWGRGNALHPVNAVTPVIAGNRVAYRHGVLTEWWRVLPVGFEQGFTIARRPAGEGELTLALAAHGKAATNGGTVSIGMLRYGGLVVTDADGTVVPAELGTRNGRILIAVNDGNARYPLTIDPLVWIEQKVTASDRAVDDSFGYSAAVSADTAVVGVYYATVDGDQARGAAYVFTRSGGNWIQQQKLTADDGSSGDLFGSSVALSGSTAIVGAPDADVNGNTDEGAAYVYVESGGVWSQIQKLTSNDGAAFDTFGCSLALDGSTALIGASGANSYQGLVYEFSESGGTWSQTQEIAASDGMPYDQFGYAVALDGQTAVVGANDATVGGTTGQGAAYMFTASGGTWSEAQKLTASDGAEDDGFGSAAALNGPTVLVSAPHNDVGRGAVYVFVDSNGSWSETQKLVEENSPGTDYFGMSVSLDGGVAFVGTPFANLGDNSLQGAVYVFTSAGGIWSQTQKLTASDGQSGDLFGLSVAQDGTDAFVGALGADGLIGAGYFYGGSDLALSVSAPSKVTQDDNFTSQVIATNSSSTTSPAVAVTATVPAGATFVSANTTQGSCSLSSGIVSCDLGQISGNGGTATANVTLKASGGAGDTIKNTASVNKATPALTAGAPTTIESSGGGGGGSSSSGGGGLTTPLSLCLLGLLGVAALARRRR